MFQEKKFISAHDIKKLYREGQRDFSNITCEEGALDNFNFSGANFRNSNFKGSTFRASNLSDCDFTDANVSWADMEHTTLTRTNFTRADIKYSTLSNSVLNETIFREADLSYSLLFNVIKGDGDFTDSIEHETAWDESDITPEAYDKVKRALSRSGLSGEIKRIVDTKVSRFQHLVDTLRGIGQSIGNKLFGSATNVYSTSERSQDPTQRGVYSSLGTGGSGHTYTGTSQRGVYAGIGEEKDPFGKEKKKGHSYVT
jgi:hypothetical protein